MTKANLHRASTASQPPRPRLDRAALLFAARASKVLRLAGLAEVVGNEECGHRRNDAIHDRG